jgi:hypothetical protein
MKKRIPKIDRKAEADALNKEMDRRTAEWMGKFCPIPGCGNDCKMCRAYVPAWVEEQNGHKVVRGPDCRAMAGEARGEQKEVAR